jgi:2-C-methyl-D-erythritol 4-phosphate cytidylyltransferase
LPTQWIGIDFMRRKRRRFSSVYCSNKLHAVDAENVSVTDEVSAVEQLSHKVVLVLKKDFNLRITYPRDLPLAEFVL